MDSSSKIYHRLRAIFPRIPRHIIEDAVAHTVEASLREKREGVLYSVTVARNYIVNRIRYESKFVSWDDALMEGRRELLCHISDAAIDFTLIVGKHFTPKDAAALMAFVMGGYTLRELAKDFPWRKKSSWQRFLMFTALPLLRKKLTGYGHRR